MVEEKQEGDVFYSPPPGKIGLSMAYGLVILVDHVNLNDVSPLVREVLGLEAGGADGHSRPTASNSADSSDVNT